MSNNVSSNYANPITARPPAANNSLPTAPAPLAQPQINDSLSVSAPGTNAASVTPSPDMRNDLLQLRKQLMDVSRDLNAMLQQLQTPPQGAQALPQGPQALPGLAPDNQGAAQPSGGIAPIPLPTQSQAGGAYTVQPGDYLWKIAREQMGDANLWPAIYQANHNAIGDNPNLLQPGQVLQLPTGNAQPQQQPMPQQMPQPIQQQQPMQPSQQQMPQPIQQQQQPMPQQATGVGDVNPVATNRQLADQQVQGVSQQFHLWGASGPVTADSRANVAAFMDELDSYETAYRGQVYGPGMEAVAQNPQEVQVFHQSVAEIQRALSYLIQFGRLHPTLANGQPVQGLNTTGSYFKLDTQGNPQKDAQGNMVMDDAFVAAITQFKQDAGIHQNYRLQDGSFGINEYVGPNTTAALKQALLAMKAPNGQAQPASNQTQMQLPQQLPQQQLAPQQQQQPQQNAGPGLQYQPMQQQPQAQPQTSGLQYQAPASQGGLPYQPTAQQPQQQFQPAQQQQFQPAPQQQFQPAPQQQFQPAQQQQFQPAQQQQFQPAPQQQFQPAPQQQFQPAPQQQFQPAPQQQFQPAPQQQFQPAPQQPQYQVAPQQANYQAAPQQQQPAQQPSANLQPGQLAYIPPIPLPGQRS